MDSKEFFSWRKCVISSDLYSVTKHVLLTLSCHYSDMGDGIYPSIQTLARECSLSERSIYDHLNNSTAKGWLRISKHGFGDQRWNRNEYKLTLPDGFIPDLEKKKALNVVQKGHEPRSKGHERDDKMALNHVHPNTQENTKENTPVNTGAVSRAPRSTVSTDFALPDWIPKDAWEGFEEMRRRIRKPLTERARQLTITNLQKLRDDEGEDPVACLDQSTQRGWLGVFPVRHNGNGHTRKIFDAAPGEAW